MAGKSDAYEFNFLSMTFAGKAITNICSTGGTTSIWLALCTADPGDAGSTAAEGGYAQYTRIATDRSTGATGWAVTSGTSAAVATASPNATIGFPQNTSTSTGTFTHVSVYPSSTSIGSAALYSGAISPTINFSQNVTPQLTTGSSVTED
jgi:hypothetical protein